MEEGRLIISIENEREQKRRGETGPACRSMRLINKRHPVPGLLALTCQLTAPGRGWQKPENFNNFPKFSKIGRVTVINGSVGARRWHVSDEFKEAKLLFV